MKLRHKLLILGVGLTVVIMFIAGLFSYILYRQKTLNNLFRTIDDSLTELEDSFSEGSYLSSINSLKSYILEVYESNPDATAGLEGEELYEKCRDTYFKIYAKKPGIIGLSREDAKLRQDYFVLSNILDNSLITPGVVNSFICYNDSERGRIVYLIDSQYGLDAKLYETMILPGAFYEIGQNDERIYSSESKFNEYYMGGKYYKYTDVYAIVNEGTDSESSEYIATVFINYDTAVAEKSINSFLITELIAMSIGAVVLSVLFMLLAHFIFTKNVGKLNQSAKNFTESMASGKKLTVINPEVNSKDEIGVLSHSFITMEEGIIEYAEKIASDAKERERINAELSIAQEIQMEALPVCNFTDGKVNVAAYISPAKQVGGDFYDYFYIDKNRFAVVIADVSGKGIPAALFMMKAKGLIKSKLTECGDVQKTAYFVNNALCENNKAMLFVTAFIGVVNLNDMHMECVSAGHEKPYIIGNYAEKLKISSNFVLGAQKDFVYSKDEFDISNKKLFLFTDGLNEAINDNSEEFGYERIEKSLSAKHIDIIGGLRKDLNDFVGNSEPFDDVTMLLLGFGGALSKSFNNPDFSAIEELTDSFNLAFSYLNNETIAKMDIVIDELMNNYISYEKVENHKIGFIAEEKQSVLTMKFLSNGEEFDPLSVNDKYIEKGQTNLTVGGFGLTITKSLSDNLIYERIDEQNVITVVKNLSRQDYK